MKAEQPIAITGIGCRFPGDVNSPGEFWSLLEAGRNAIVEIPPERDDLNQLRELAREPENSALRKGGFLSNVKSFDAGFFQIAPREARLIDPQQRLMLEVAYEALEDAGINPDDLRGSRTGTYTGIWNIDYTRRLLAADALPELYGITGTDSYSLAGRISYFLDLRGPSVITTTACSTSLVALHQAAQALRDGECDLALAGGVNLINHHYISQAFAASHMLSPEWMCHFGDERSAGYVRGEGAGMVVLKPFDQAIRDGDRVYALILSSAVNNDGQTGGSLMQPGKEGQAALLREIYGQEPGKVDPAMVDFVECHGTGTRVGDPVETQALAAVIGEGRERSLLLGSVKTNIGHLESAAGIAGVIKTALSLAHRKIPASLHFEKPNPKIPWEEGHLRIPVENMDWPEAGESRLAGVNSFGISGINAHLVLRSFEPGPVDNPEAVADGLRLLTLSAHSSESLTASFDRWIDFLSEPRAQDDFSDIVYTANKRRKNWPFRIAIVGDSAADCANQLKQHRDGGSAPRLSRGYTQEEFLRAPVFVFSGQSGPFWPVAPELLEIDAVRSKLKECQDVLEDIAGFSLIKEFSADANDSLLNRTECLQPAFCALQIALAHWWREQGVEPSAVIGHSRGEIPAAVVSGALSLEDGLRVAFERGRLTRRLAGRGDMIFVEMDLPRLEAVVQDLEAPLDFAVRNSPRHHVLAGEIEAIHQAAARLSAMDVFHKVMGADWAGHSHLVEPFERELADSLKEIKAQSVRIPFVSTVTGTFFDSEDRVDANYWGRNLRKRVCFEQGMNALLESGHSTFLELGPHPSLAVAINQCIIHGPEGAGVILRSLHRDVPPRECLLTSLANLYCHGHAIDLPDRGNVLSLPPYPFDREDFWFEEHPQSARHQAGGQSEAGPADSVGGAIDLAIQRSVEGAVERVFSRLLDERKDGFLPINNNANEAAIPVPIDDAPGPVAVEDPAPGWRAQQVREIVEQEAGAVLGLSPGKLKPGVGLKQLGMDSMMAADLVRRLNGKFGKDFNTTVAFNYPNIEKLSAFLSAEVVVEPATKKDAPLAGPAGPKPQTEIHQVPGSRGDNELHDDDVVVIGMSCRFPGGVGLEQYWDLLRRGGDAVAPVPEKRFKMGLRLEDYYDPVPNKPGKIVVREAALLEDIDMFDPGFFDISPREALSMDPQQRLALEVAYEALEHAGLPISSLSGMKGGVFIGATSSEYATLQNDPELMDVYSYTGGALHSIPGRLAYTFGLEGPSPAVDAACSSSLVAVHLAVQSLQKSESDIALAGGVNLILLPDTYLNIARSGALAADGRCKTFDETADGYGRAEGCGIIVLKRYRDAREDGDDIIAVIKGSASKQDGASSGLTVPNGPAQARLIQEALARAELLPRDIQFVEAHGTGTSLGDPIEVESIGTALGEGRLPDEELIVGSVKTNIGHTEAAAGIAGLIKVILSLQHESIPRHLHYKKKNPKIDFAKIPARVPVESVPWQAGRRRRAAGVSSFGITGSISHVIVSDLPRAARERDSAEDRTGEDRTGEQSLPGLLPLSAKSDWSLRRHAKRIRNFLQDHPEASLADVGYTMALRRDHQEVRAAIAYEAREKLLEGLDQLERGGESPGLFRGQAGRRKIVFVFSGNGSGWPGMARDLFREESVFREEFERWHEALEPWIDWSLIDALNADDFLERMEEPGVFQPLCMAIQSSLVRMYRTYGIEPDLVLGHSMGEVAAAYAAGIFSRADAARLIALRGQAIDGVTGGRTATIELSESEVLARIEAYGGRLEIAGVNGPHSSTVAGDRDAIADLLADLASTNVFRREVNMPFAGHSKQMEPALPGFERSLTGIRPKVARVPMLSTVTATTLAGPECGPAYWARNMREPVRFWSAIEGLDSSEFVFAEIGPHPVLSFYIRQNKGEGSQVTSSLKRDGDGRFEFLSSLGALYTVGKNPDWSLLYPDAKFVRLPAYPFQKESYWIKFPDAKGISPWDQPEEDASSMLGHRIEMAGGTLWESYRELNDLFWARDHIIQKTIVIPGTAMIELAISGGIADSGPVSPDRPLVLQDIEFKHGVFFQEDRPRRIQLKLDGYGQEEARPFSVSSRSVRNKGESTWRLHSDGILSRNQERERPGNLNPGKLRDSMDWEISSAEFYAECTRIGVQWGAHFQAEGPCFGKKGEALRRVVPVQLPESDTGKYFIHPALLDVALQSIFAVFPSARDEQGHFRVRGSFMGHSIEEVIVYESPPQLNREFWSYCNLREGDQDQGDVSRAADFHLCDESGRVFMEVRGLRMRFLEEIGADDYSRQIEDWLYSISWNKLLPPEHREPKTRKQESYLIFAHETGVGPILAQRLTAAGNRCFLIGQGKDFSVRSDDVIRLNPLNPEHFSQLQNFLGNATGDPFDEGCHVLFLWALDFTPAQFADASLTFHETVDLSLGGLLHALKAMATWKVNILDCAVVTRGAWSIDPGDTSAGKNNRGEYPEVNPLHSALWGFGRSMIEEKPELRLRLVDLDSRASVGEHVTSLISNLAAPGSFTEKQIAFRSGETWAARLIRRESAPPMGKLPVDANATYLVSGGLGDLGLRAALRIVEQGGRHLVLFGRRLNPIPDETDWDRDDHDPEVAEKIKHLKFLKFLGAKIITRSLDVADEGAMRSMIEQDLKHLPPVKGVVHAAGVSVRRGLEDIDLENLREDIAAKLFGAWNLHESFENLDFFVLYSSAASVLNSPLAGTYAAANAFMDGLAWYRRGLGRPATAINWGIWSESAMARDLYKSDDALRGVSTIDPEAGLDSLAGLVISGSPQTMVFPVNWHEWARYHGHAIQDPFFSEVLSDVALDAHAGEDDTKWDRETILAVPSGERHSLLNQMLGQDIGRILKLSEPVTDYGELLANLGMDSLMSVELKRELEHKLGLSIPLLAIISSPGIQSLGRNLLEELQPDAAEFGAEVTAVNTAADSSGPERVSFASADGLTIHGHLSLPSGAGPFPAVVVHAPYRGGALDDSGQYVHMQEHAPLVQRGFAVLTVDQRGAPGHGIEFSNRIEIGGRDVDDVIAAALYLQQKREEIDGERLGFLGTSRGAYAGLLAAGRRPDLWKGAVFNMGFYDPISQLRDEERGRSQNTGFSALLGKDPEELNRYFRRKERLPLENLKDVNFPFFVIHGEDDPMTRFYQPLLLLAAARALGIPTNFEVVPSLKHDIEFKHKDWPRLWGKIGDFLERLGE